MAANSRPLQTPSHQDTLNSIYHDSLTVNNHPLSKSSSSLACIGQLSSEERQSNKQDLKKSLSSTVCQVLAGENDARNAFSPELSALRSGAVESASAARTVSDQSPANNAQNRTQTANHLLADQTPHPWEGKDTVMHVKSSTIENVPTVCGACQQSANRVGKLGIAVQRSHSDLVCSCKQQGSVTERLVDNSSLQSSRYGFGTYENTYQNCMVLIPALHRDQKVPTNNFESGGVPQNSTVYTDPGTFHNTGLGPHMPGNGFTNRTMHNESTGIIQGGIICSNVSSSMYSPMIKTIHNSTAVPCNTRHESLIKVDATVPAYCHSLPISSIQLVPRLVCSISESGKEQVTPGSCNSFFTSEATTFPKLVSSVSESGLDAKRILKCCHVPREQLPDTQHCAQESTTEQEMQAAYLLLNNPQCADMMKTKDTWTMTSMNDLTKALKPLLECKDAEVQTISTIEYKSVATSPSVVIQDHPHVFPEVNLEPDLEDAKSPVREVRWDDEGMTWEVYGAAVDPEVLGLAIQKHLEIQIEQFQTNTIQLSRKGTEEPSDKDPSHITKGEKKRPFRTMMHSLRNPSCCTRSSTAVE
ncbi:G protein-regulated inducer of neurite outgrowth 2 [Alligator mississippiensis]|uniref:G protein-regulated inducer of neurite outgrowth 2 n=1 Tax=Alligator mississippiensis TaxID=8496 RepID=UPI0003D073A0|nr:G protein-regulated inducer of neurite outgrowth 2 [Alligator mississippiensis]XP_019352630.1 G protein-regulated inducer of neurite outgrowth 2 [Alligator mississippiensis]XP_059585804.1 G protein-regulated inducer of neurite outgrowth 2 [Alligator mississippiensis]XP_059585805.1 G protein-regulated inducer of neurite outgrowth 2 [Alligator mississippiensis]XP_059585806.1 G protein-regulated inducer of neurite outgrowth 2 [Alligator mississippiensis]